MAWFKTDDGLWGHPKWRACTKGARALWATAGSWSADQLTDGFIPRHVLPILDGTARDAQRLVEAGLWEVTDSGWIFHDWHLYQPTRADVMAQREREREKKARWRERAGRDTDGRFRSTGESPVDTPRDTTVDTPGDTRTGPPGTPQGSPRGGPPVPDPTRPDPTRKKSRAGARAGDTHPDPASQTNGHPVTFEEFWGTYPKPVAEKLARAAWSRAVATTPASTILAGLESQLALLQGTDPKFIPNPSTWLNDGRWTDKAPTTNGGDEWDLPRVTREQ